MTTLTPERLAEMRELLAKATPGPWIAQTDALSAITEIVRDLGREHPDEHPVLMVDGMRTDEDCLAADFNLVALLRNNAEALLSAASDMAKLSDPAAVVANMLRGSIATPDIRDMLHVYGADALARWDAAERGDYAVGHAAGVMEEREGCAQLLNEHHKTDGPGLQWFADTLAKAIRSRPSPAASQPDICPTCRGCGYQDPAVGSICADCGGSGGVPAAPAVTMAEVVEVLTAIRDGDDSPECCGHGQGSPPECCGNPIRGLDRAQHKARALLSRLSPSPAATAEGGGE